MTGPAHFHPQIEVVAASLEQKPAIASLLELYTHDFSEFVHLDIGPDGRFGYRDLDLYWTDPQRFPFLLYAGQRLAGFFLVQGIPRGHALVWDMTEFFILRGYRRRSIGTRVAQEAFRRFPGDWQVRVMHSNVPACAFWSRAVREYAGSAAHLDHTKAAGREWEVFSFSSPTGG